MIVSVFPQRGPALGDTPVTIIGQNFQFRGVVTVVSASGPIGECRSLDTVNMTYSPELIRYANPDLLLPVLVSLSDLIVVSM